MQKRKILMIVGDFGEDLEIYFPYQVLTMLGFQVDVGCPSRKSGDKIKTAVHDFRDNDQTYCESRGHDFILNIDLDTIELIDYCGLVLPGGRAPEYLRLHQNVLNIVDQFVKSHKPIAAVCHGIQLLTAVGGLKDRQLTCYPACQFEVTAIGAQYKNVGYDDVVVDKNIVTSPAWPGHARCYEEFIKLLNVKIVHE